MSEEESKTCIDFKIQSCPFVRRISGVRCEWFFCYENCLSEKMLSCRADLSVRKLTVLVCAKSPTVNLGHITPNVLQLLTVFCYVKLRIWALTRKKLEVGAVMCSLPPQSSIRFGLNVSAYFIFLKTKRSTCSLSLLGQGILNSISFLNGSPNWLLILSPCL